MDVVNVESANLDDLKKRFVEICATINRPGMVLTSILRRQARASTATILAGCWSIASMCTTSFLGLWLAILNWRSHRRRWRSLRCSTT